MNREIKFRFWRDGKIQSAHQLNAYVNTGNNFAGDGEILMQFTGERDFEDKEIYVGDILSDKWKVEVYQNNEGTFMVKFHTNPKINKPVSLRKYLIGREMARTSEKDCIIIGNIYENPELL